MPRLPTCPAALTAALLAALPLLAPAADQVPRVDFGYAFGTPHRITVAPPDSALGRYLPELRKQSDAIVLLAFTDEDTMLNLANLFYEVNVIVGGRVPQPFQAGA